MNWSKFPPSILALGKGYAIVMSLAFGSINTVKVGIHAYNSCTGSMTTTTTFNQEPAVVQYHSSEPCPTCLDVNMDDPLPTYNGRPLDVDQLVAQESNTLQIISSSTPLTTNFTSTQNSTNPLTTSTLYPEPSLVASGTHWSEITLDSLDTLISWLMSPTSKVIFHGMNVATSRAISPQQPRAWLVILQRLASLLLSSALAYWYKRQRGSRDARRAEAASSTANAQLPTGTTATQSALFERFDEIIHDSQHDPAAGRLALQRYLSDIANDEDAKRAEWQLIEQRSLSDIAATQAKEAMALKKSKVSRAANQVRRSRKITYWKGRQAGYSSAMTKQKWKSLPLDPTEDDSMVVPPDDSTATSNKVAPDAIDFSAYTDEELETLPEWLQYLASTTEECGTRETKRAACADWSIMSTGQEISAIEEMHQDPYPSSRLCVKDINQLIDDPAWRIYMAASSVVGAKCIMSGAIQDDGHMDDWSPEEEGPVWPIGYPNYQPPTSRFISLETVVEEVTGEWEHDPAEGEDLDWPSRPLEECDRLEGESGKSFSYLKYESKPTLSPDGERLLVAVKLLSYMEWHKLYLKAGHGTEEDHKPKHVSDDVAAKTVKEEDMAQWRKDSIHYCERQAASLQEKIAKLSTGPEVVAGSSSDTRSDNRDVGNGDSQSQPDPCTDVSIQPHQAEHQPKEQSKSEKRRDERKRAKARKAKEPLSSNNEA